MYTGILLRTDTHVNFDTDVLVHREIAVSPNGLGMGVDRGSGVESFWLNYDYLSKISELDVDGNVATVGFKTSDIPITFDSGWLQHDINGVKINDNLFHNSLSYISSITSTTLTFTDKGSTPVLTSLNIADLKTASSAAPAIVFSTENTITSNFNNTVVFIKDGTIIGEGGGSTEITLTAIPGSGKRIYAYTLDNNLNKSLNSSLEITQDATVSLLSNSVLSGAVVNECSLESNTSLTATAIP